MSDSSSLFEVLTARTRRRILLLLYENSSIQVPEALRTRGGTQPKRAQAQTEVGQTRSAARTHGSPDEIQLYHTHLPRLEKAGFIEWDQETQTVTRGPKFVMIEPALDVLVSNTDKFPPDLF